LKAVVLLSGGVDSSVLLGKMLSYRDEIALALSFNYGQIHRKELDCARTIAEHYHVPWKCMAIANTFEDINTPLLGVGDIPEEAYDTSPGVPVTYVQNRNMILLAIAASQALNIGADVVAYAAHADDAKIAAYPDCSEEFFDKMNAVLETQGVKLFAPFIDKNKSSIVAKGLQLGVPFEHTWSCYKGEEEACGVCGTCRDRAEAFRVCGAVDPIRYQARRG